MSEGIAMSEGIDGCPTFATAYVGRKRWAQPQRSLSPHPLADSNQFALLSLFLSQA
jgi:hypothetical protein